MRGRGDAWVGGWRERTARCDAPRTNAGLIRTNATHCNRPKPNAVRGALQWPKPNAVRGVHGAIAPAGRRRCRWRRTWGRATRPRARSARAGCSTAGGSCWRTWLGLGLGSGLGLGLGLRLVVGAHQPVAQQDLVARLRLAAAARHAVRVGLRVLRLGLGLGLGLGLRVRFRVRVRA